MELLPRRLSSESFRTAPPWGVGGFEIPGVLLCLGFLGGSYLSFRSTNLRHQPNGGRPMSDKAQGQRHVRLEIREQKLVNATGEASVSLSVFCTERGCSTSLSQCVLCDKCIGMRLCSRASGGAIHCYSLEPNGPTDPPTLGRGAIPASTLAETAPEPLVNRVMNHHVVCVDHDVPATLLAQLVDDEGMDCVAVLNNRGEPQGIVSRATLNAWGLLGSTKKAPSQSPARARLVAEEIMQTPAFVLLESAPLSRAAAMLAYERADCLIIITQQRTIVGTLSPLDIARWVALRGGFVIPPRDPKSSQ